MADWDPNNPDYCDTFWGSHGCGLKPGHEGPCLCDHRFVTDDEGNLQGTVEEYAEGVAAPPYQGEETWWHSNHGTPTPPQTIEAWIAALPTHFIGEVTMTECGLDEPKGAVALMIDQVTCEKCLRSLNDE